MKKVIKISIAIIIVSSSLLVNSCKKPKDGEPGVPGKDGNSKVYSHTYSVPSWSNNGSFWYTQLAFSELTSDNINTAAVQVYWGTNSNTWVAAPYTYVSSTNYLMSYLTTINLVEVRWESNGVTLGSSPNTIFSATTQIKIVVIPPAAKQANPNVDLNNYNEVKKVFNLK